MQNVSAVIFDLGGVILDIDYKATEMAMQQLLGARGALFYQSAKQAAVFDDFETGRIEAAEFRDRIRGAAARDISDAAIDQAWNAMLGKLSIAIMAYIRQVAVKHRVFLLSNTNSIHLHAFAKIADQVLQGAAFNDYFEKAYYSHEIGLRKPDPVIFQYLIEKHQLKPAQTLFIDDVLPNVEAARSIGLQAFHLREHLLSAPLQFLLE